MPLAGVVPAQSLPLGRFTLRDLATQWYQTFVMGARCPFFCRMILRCGGGRGATFARGAAPRGVREARRRHSDVQRGGQPGGADRGVVRAARRSVRSARARRRRRFAGRYRRGGRGGGAALAGRVDVLRRSAKRGLAAAYVAGFEHALQGGAAYVAQMDGDGSHDPRALPEMLAAIGGADLVVGSRYAPGDSRDFRQGYYRRMSAAW